jgi:hypothetical protein
MGRRWVTVGIIQVTCALAALVLSQPTPVKSDLFACQCFHLTCERFHLTCERFHLTCKRSYPHL